MAFVSSLSLCSFVRRPALRHGERASISRLRTASRHAHATSTTRASIESDVSAKLKQAMKARDTERLKALRAIRAAFLTAMKAEGGPDSLSDKDAVAVLRKLAKMRHESIDMYAKGGRNDLADDERAELAVITEWLPQLASADKVTQWAKDAVEKTGASGPSDMGKVMGFVMKDHREEVDGNQLRKILSQLLK